MFKALHSRYLLEGKGRSLHRACTNRTLNNYFLNQGRKPGKGSKHTQKFNKAGPDSGSHSKSAQESADGGKEDWTVSLSRSFAFARTQKFGVQKL